MAAQSGKMETFEWTGKDGRGAKKKGEMSGPNVAVVKAQLRKQGIRVDKVSKKSKGLLSGANKKAIKPMDIAIFTRQLATMMKSGIPLVQAFEIVGEGLENPSMREIVGQIRDDVSSGTNFAESIRKHPRQFDELFCNLVEAGEQSGALETMLDRLATYKEKSEALKAKIKKAMNYPITVVSIAIIVTGILLVKVVPQFAATFSSFGAQLPAFTLLVLHMSDFMIAWWYWVLGFIVVAAYSFKEAKLRSKKFADNIERLSLKLPVMGEIIEKSALARFTRTLATTFAAGVPLPDALTSCAGATGNVVYRTALLKVRDDVTTGQQLTYSLRAAQLFPIMILQMVSIGEESGALDAMLDKCATFYEAEVDNAVDGLTAMMEPLIMAVLGVLVGGLMIAMYMPIFQIGSVV
ncbi:MAG TPA: type II secretion system F family protein [Candidatus Acidoferrum sp.]|nr:type II secretion system F family protein [Candidatus Acidoferrum sp.]